jgi:hypothetical protein
MQRTKVLVIGAGLFLAAGTAAFAEGDAPVPAPDQNVSAVVPVTGGGGYGDLPISERALVLPKSTIAAYGDFDIVEAQVTTITGTPPVMTTSTSTTEALRVGGAYGISDKLTAGLDYSIGFNNSGKGPLQLYGEYQVAHSGKLEVAAGADLIVDLGGASTTEALGLGVNLRYTVAPKIVIFTGTPIAPAPAGNQLTIGFNSNAPIALDLPIGGGFQVNPKLFAFLETVIAHIKISNTANAFIFADFIPIQAGVLYSVSNKLDVGAVIADNLKAAGDTFAISLVGRFYLGK